MVLEGWRHAPIKLLCESIIDCVNKTAPVVDYETPYKMIRTTNVRHGKVDTDNVRYVEAETYKNWVRRGAPRKGDLIFTREAPVGEAGILDSDDSVFLGQRTMMYRADPSKSNNLFLFYSLQTSFCRKQIEDLSNGGTVAHMRVPDCGEIIIRVPPVSEQRKIAKILCTWDRAIEVTEKLLSNSQQQKKFLMQHLLTGKKRFPGFSGEWVRVKFEKILTIEIGGTPSRSNPQYWDDQKQTQNRWLSIADLKGNKISNTKEYISDLGVKNSNVSLVPAGTVVMSFKLTIGRRALLETDSYTNEAICALLIKDTEILDKIYLFHALDIVDFDQEIDQAVKGKTLNKAKLKRLRLNLPPLKEQQKIASVLSAADKEIEVLHYKLDCLKQEKKALMQQLLTGKRRVKVDEKEISQKEAARA